MAESKAEQAERELHHRHAAAKPAVYTRALGPGLITGASDDDPSGIGTYSQTGAQFGLGHLWTAPLTLPLMAAVQEICARIALASGTGLAENIRRQHPRAVLYACVLLLCVANTVNIGADLGAMAAAARLLVRLPFLAWLVGFTLLSVLLEVFISYQRYARFLRYLTFSLLAYVFEAFVVRVQWRTALVHTIAPSFRMNREVLMNLVAILGTTISPYLFFWQAGQEVEEEIAEGRRTRAARRGVTGVELKWMRLDVFAGMLVSIVVMYFIMLTTAVTLFPHGVHTIESAPEAAEALRPLAGTFAYALFAIGVVGTGLLAVPVLAGSAAYAVAEAFVLRRGLYLKLRQAHGFYAVIAVSTLVGAGINLLHINPMRALYYTAVVNGMIAPVLLACIMLLANNRSIMGRRANGPLANVLGWTATALMASAALAALVALTRGEGGAAREALSG
jgi:NRAMP (natural resistance-associated macrophage protein)-like metal ion transporter